MHDDLTTRIEGALRVQTEHESRHGVSPADIAALTARVRGARRRRTAGHAALAAAVVVVVGAGAVFGLQDRPVPQPAHTPTPVPTSEATPAPSATAVPTPVPEPSAPALEPVNLPGLPAMYRAPEGLLEQTGPGWFLVRYASGLYEPVPGDGERVSLAVSAPTGELYHLLDLAERRAIPVRWERPDVARVAFGSGGAGWLDLRTGEVTSDDRLPAEVQWLGSTADGEVWARWWGAASPMLYVLPAQGPARELEVPLISGVLSPDGRTVVGDRGDLSLAAVDLRTGDVTVLALPAGQQCTSTGWLDSTGVLASCVDPQPADSTSMWYHDEHGGQVVRLDAAGGLPRTLQAIDSDGPVPWRGSHVRDGVVVHIGAPLVSGSGDCYDFCYGGAYQWIDGRGSVEVPLSPEMVDTVCGVQPGRDGLLLWTGDVCYEETTGGQWWRVDDATGAVRLVAPAVESDLRLGAMPQLVERVVP
ncbi:hypothetical protein J1G43_00240 [Cellulomonas sp. zg-ZUI22]|uniref:hypothetical protein n=1 Tax=Cellulomonas sp. zg-ZUI22 TaxID=2816955 RepID=UPI001A9400D8|nr:hypothetical protein [Cellulomonas sp. zg-ZUI22]MBO0898395.1 hypothetical protein [Cellulomonas sp. zg-ZUI22]